MRILEFRYDCGWVYSIRMLPGQAKAELVSRVGRRVRQIHKRSCATCRHAKSPRTRSLHPDESALPGPNLD